jgi:hypothetical protein
MISSRTPEALPPPEELEGRCRAMAVLDAIVCPLFEGRQFRFDAFHGPDQRIARHDTYEGDGWLIWFTSRGVVIRGFWHESPLSPWAQDPAAPRLWPNLFSGLPDELANGPKLPSDGIEAITFCLWWDDKEPRWCTGSVTYPDLEYADPDGSEYLLDVLSGEAAYQQHIEEVYERSVSLDGIQRIYRQEPLTAEVVHAIEEAADVDLAMAVAKAAGYPRRA